MLDIAKRCGVSVTTVSRALRNKGDISKGTKEYILSVAKQLNYTANIPARVLAGGPSNTIGLIVADNANPYYAKMIRGVEDTARKAGYGIILFNTNEEPELEARGHQMLLENKVDGLLITSIKTGETPLQTLQGLKVPFVLLNRYIEDFDTDWVRSDNKLGAYLVISHLCSKGHSRIVHITGSEQISSVRERIAGYRQALEEHNYSFDRQLIFSCDLKLEGGYKCTKAALTQINPRPTAIFAYSDLLAIGVMKALHELGLLVPDDIALIGYDDIEYAQFLEPPLTTVDQFAYEIGQKGIEILLEKIEWPEDKKWELQHIIVKPELKVRASSGAS